MAGRKKGRSRFFYSSIYLGIIVIVGSLLYGAWQLIVIIYYFIISNWVISTVGGIALIFSTILLIVITKSDASSQSKRRISIYVWGFVALTIATMIGYNPVKTFVSPPPTLIPTFTPSPTYTSAPTHTPTKTITPKPTRTPLPPTNTPIPAICVTNCAEIQIINDTGGFLAFSVSGPGESEWSISIGNRTLKVKPGTYAITATASCGTDFDTITLAAGDVEEITYWCSTSP